ncbi:quinone oxidoreductase family protein [Peribacillus alkalitolerans]|uniref:quinone oxidoreductase family protein n=1 Tax=Peribacillus alkalitolerans TaxID=1550385 RepID=UPI0013D1858B|nr:zinc-binding dehydrogenase [Peribacillus alkalitolerans]
MQAVMVTEWGSTDGMVLMEVDRPSIKAHQVLIKVAATSVNFADIKTRHGKKGAGKLPYIPGLDVAGIVVEVGNEVTEFQVGQRVVAFPSQGSYAEYVVADEVLTYVLPDGIDFETAAASPIVAFLSHKLIVDVARLQKGEKVVIHAAAGGVGTTLIQLAKLMGAGMVIGTVGSPEKKEVALEAGADHVLLYTDEVFSYQVHEITGGKGADVVFDSISGQVAERSLECLAPYGRLVHFGNSSGEVGSFRTVDFHSSCRAVLGFSLGTTRQKRPASLKETAEQVFPYIVSRQLKVKIGKRFLLSEASQAHEWVESRKSTGKVLLIVDEELCKN